MLTRLKQNPIVLKCMGCGGKPDTPSDVPVTVVSSEKQSLAASTVNVKSIEEDETILAGRKGYEPHEAPHEVEVESTSLEPEEEIRPPSNLGTGVINSSSIGTSKSQNNSGRLVNQNSNHVAMVSTTESSDDNAEEVVAVTKDETAEQTAEEGEVNKEDYASSDNIINFDPIIVNHEEIELTSKIADIHIEMPQPAEPMGTGAIHADYVPSEINQSPYFQISPSTFQQNDGTAVADPSAAVPPATNYDDYGFKPQNLFPSFDLGSFDLFKSTEDYLKNITAENAAHEIKVDTPFKSAEDTPGKIGRGEGEGVDIAPQSLEIKEEESEEEVKEEAKVEEEGEVIDEEKVKSEEAKADSPIEYPVNFHVDALDLDSLLLQGQGFRSNLSSSTPNTTAGPKLHSVVSGVQLPAGIISTIQNSNLNGTSSVTSGSGAFEPLRTGKIHGVSLNHTGIPELPPMTSSNGGQLMSSNMGNMNYQNLTNSTLLTPRSLSVGTGLNLGPLPSFRDLDGNPITVNPTNLSGSNNGLLTPTLNFTNGVTNLLGIQSVPQRNISTTSLSQQNNSTGNPTTNSSVPVKASAAPEKPQSIEVEEKSVEVSNSENDLNSASEEEKVDVEVVANATAAEVTVGTPGGKSAEVTADEE